MVDTPGHRRIAQTTHTLFSGRVQLYRRPEGRYWQCATRVGGRRFRHTTGESELARAKDVAEEWYLDLRGRSRNGEITPDRPRERTFAEAAEAYIREVRVLAATTRSPVYVKLLEMRMRRHLIPYFGKTPLTAINRGAVRAYRVKRAEERMAETATEDSPGRPPARSTIAQEIVHLRQTLKWAEGVGWIPFVPNLSQPYMTQGKRGRRAWFSPEEYRQLYEATRRRTEDPKRRGFRRKYEDLHDFVLFMANTGLRPDEAWRLEFRDVSIEDDIATKSTILVIDVRGKTGVGYCKSMPNAVHPFERLLARRRLEAAVQAELDKLPKGTVPWKVDLVRRELEADYASGKRKFATPVSPTARVFPSFSRDLFNAILKEEGLKEDRDGQKRTAYSLRHTYISMRLMEGANIHQIANNCRTSVQMIEEFYAAHIKDRLDASSINVMRSRPVREAARKSAARRPKA
jgi:integrase